MAAFVFVTAGIQSYLNRLGGLARGLAGRGHTVTVLSLRDTAPWSPPPGVDVRRLNLPVQFVRRPGRLRFRSALREQESRVARQILDSRILMTALGEMQPDLVIADYELSAQIIQLIGAGQPLVLLEYECSPLQTGRVPIPSSSRVPPADGFAPGFCRLSWAAGLTKRRLRLAASAAYYGRHDWWQTVRRAARDVGLDLACHASRRHWHYLTFPGVPTLYLAPTALDFPNEAPNPAFRVGPIVDLEREESVDDPGYRAAMAALQSTGLPLVYCAMGSLLSDQSYCEQVIAGFAGRSDRALLLAAGKHAASLGGRGLPGNVQVVGYAPQLDVLRHARLMLTHAGPASIFEAILAGVPMVCFSGGKKEEDGNAARVAFHKLGLRGRAADRTSAAIAALTGQVLNDPGFRQRVTAMRARFLEQHDGERGVELLERAALDGPDRLGWQAF